MKNTLKKKIRVGKILKIISEDVNEDNKRELEWVKDIGKPMPDFCRLSISVTPFFMSDDEVIKRYGYLSK